MQASDQSQVFTHHLLGAHTPLWRNYTPSLHYAPPLPLH